MARPSRKDSSPDRRKEILLLAAKVMRRNGALSTRLQDIAAEIGIAYTAFYHYFKNRDHLLEQLFLHMLKFRQDCLASTRGETGLERLCNFIRSDLTRNRNERARFSGLASLSREYRSTVNREWQSLTNQIAQLIDTGISDGSIRACDSQILARMIHAILNRFISLELLSPEYRKKIPLVVDELLTMLTQGLLSDRSQLLEPSYHLEESQQLIGPQRGVDKEMDRLQDILRTATECFNRYGSAASIPDIAARLGVSKTVVYQYAEDKQDLLFQCYMRGVQVVEMSHRIAADFGQSPLDETLIHRENLFKFHASSVGPFTLINATDYLNPQQQRRVEIRNRCVRKTSEIRLLAGVKAGQFRDGFIPEICQSVFGQTLYNLPAWDDVHSFDEIKAIMDETSSILLRGIAPI